MKPYKLVLLTFLMFLLTCCNHKAPEQKSASNKPKEQVVVFELSGMDDVIVKKDIPYLNIADSTLRMDIYYPPNFDFQRKIPAIIIVYGCTNEGQVKLTGNQFRNWSVHISLCKIIAASGMAAIVYETVDPENDLISLAKYIHSNQDKLLIDKNNIGAFTCSSNTPTAISNILNTSSNIFKCAVVYYGIFLTQDFEYLPQIDSISQKMGFKNPRLNEPKNWKKDVPLLIVRAGLDDDPYVTHSLLNFYNNAINQNLPVTLINYPNGLHGFDFYNDNDTTRMIIKSTLDFWKFNLKIKTATTVGIVNCLRTSADVVGSVRRSRQAGQLCNR